MVRYSQIGKEPIGSKSEDSQVGSNEKKEKRIVPEGGDSHGSSAAGGGQEPRTIEYHLDKNLLRKKGLNFKKKSSDAEREQKAETKKTNIGKIPWTRRGTRIKDRTRKNVLFRNGAQKKTRLHSWLNAFGSVGHDPKKGWRYKFQGPAKAGPSFVSFGTARAFSKNGNASYRYSGSNGYLNGLPLKIANKSFVFNEFYITGKNNNGECRLDNNSYDYLYYSDKAILFNQNYSYSCHFNKSSVTSLGNTTLFKKLKDIYKIAKYGNSHYSKINDPSYWLEINNTGLNATNINNTSIKMNIYLGTRKIGINSYKYIYKVILKNVPGKNDTLSLKINYFDLDLKQDFEIKPEIPAFIPSMPADLLDPLIYSKVEK